MGQSHKIFFTLDNFWRERRVEAHSNRGPSAYQPAALPLDETGSHLTGKTLSISLYDAANSRHMFTTYFLQRREQEVWRHCTNDFLLEVQLLCNSFAQQGSQKRHLAGQLNLFLRLFLEGYCIKNRCEMFFGSERVSVPSPMLNFLKVYNGELRRSITLCAAKCFLAVKGLVTLHPC